MHLIIGNMRLEKAEKQTRLIFVMESFKLQRERLDVLLKKLYSLEHLAPLV